MCNDCKKEYENILDRRFHAQPIACNHCGPEYELFFEKRQIKNLKEILKNTAEIISSGKILAMKGMADFTWHAMR